MLVVCAFLLPLLSSALDTFAVQILSGISNRYVYVTLIVFMSHTLPLIMLAIIYLFVSVKLISYTHNSIALLVITLTSFDQLQHVFNLDMSLFGRVLLIVLGSFTALFIWYVWSQKMVNIKAPNQCLQSTSLPLGD